MPPKTPSKGTKIMSKPAKSSGTSKSHGTSAAADKKGNKRKSKFVFERIENEKHVVFCSD